MLIKCRLVGGGEKDGLGRRHPYWWTSFLRGRGMPMMLMQRMVGIHSRLKFSGGGYAASAGADKSGLMTLIGQQVSPHHHHHYHNFMMVMIIIIWSDWWRIIDDKDRKMIFTNMFHLIFSMNNSSWRIFRSCQTSPFSSSFLSWCLLQLRCILDVSSSSS